MMIFFCSCRWQHRQFQHRAGNGFICLLKDFKPVTQFVKIESIPQANSENITAELVNTFSHTLKLQNWKKQGDHDDP